MRSSGKGDKTEVAKSELIGLPVVVEASGHPGFLGIAGVVVDETKNTFVVEREDGHEVRVPKRGQRFAFHTGGRSVVLHGDDIAFQPEERTKKVR